MRASSGGTNTPGDAFWRELRQEMRAIARDEARRVFKEMRPAGTAPYIVTLVQPTASATVPAAHLDVPYPGFITQVTFRSTIAGSATLDLKTRRPTQTAADIASICGLTLPSISAATDAVVPAADDWTKYVEADSTLYFYLTSVSGFDALSVSVWLRATAE